MRPGATDFDLQGRIQGTLDIPLNDEGSQEVAQAVEQLKDSQIEAVYCSCGEPACQTAGAIADALGTKVRKLENLQNLNHGLWQGMCVDEIRRKHPRVYKQWQERPESVCPPEGEMLANALGRVETTIKKLFKKHKQGVIGLVVPEPLATLVANYLRRTEPRDLWAAQQEHGHWEVIDIEPQTLSAAR